jgi:Ribulose-5-phosphate 4-epimerase and related epimerases and aldolases
MLEELKREVLAANKKLVSEHLIILTWGNVSGYDPETDLVVIKASGIEYDEMGLEHMVVCNMEGQVVESECNPSTDLATHISLYRSFPAIRGIVHTHSTYATTWAQTGEDIPCYGTTHADYFPGSVPCTRKMTDGEVRGDYEKNTGAVIAERFRDLDPEVMRAVLVRCHGPFVWGSDPMDALHNACVLEAVAETAYRTRQMLGEKQSLVDAVLLKKHYDRKFGEDAYYGQDYGKEVSA